MIDARWRNSSHPISDFSHTRLRLPFRRRGACSGPARRPTSCDRGDRLASGLIAVPCTAASVSPLPARATPQPQPTRGRNPLDCACACARRPRHAVTSHSLQCDTPYTSSHMWHTAVRHIQAGLRAYLFGHARQHEWERSTQRICVFLRVRCIALPAAVRPARGLLIAALPSRPDPRSPDWSLSGARESQISRIHPDHEAECQVESSA